MKKALIALAVVLALGGVAAWLAVHYLDVIVKVALEHYGPEVTGVAVDVADVEISAADGRGAIRGLTLGNPPGFASPRAASFGEIRVAIEPATLTADVVRIREIVIDAPRITYERGTKATNLDVIQNHIEAYVKRAAGSPAKGSADGRDRKRRFIIDRLAIRGGRVQMTNAKLKGQGLGFDLPDVLLADVGKRQGGVTASEAAALVAETLQDRIAQKVLTNIDALRRGGVEGAVDALRELLKRP
jgi:uncharacterized protein involved in outer membrane biogenesis